MQNRKFVWLVLVVTLLFAAISGPIAVSAAPESGAVVTLSMAQTSFNAKDPVTVRVTIANPTQRAVRILRWFTPADGVEEPVFAVTRDGVSSVAFTGPHYKRPDITAADYVVLKPGSSQSWDVDLATLYDFSVSGNYTIRYEAASANLHSEAANVKQGGRLTSSEVTFWVEGRANQTPEFTIEAVNGTTSFNRCTTTQQADLISARNNASTYAANALSYLNGNNQGARYTTWFGTYTSSRYTTVKSNFSKISTAMDNASVNFDCGCKKTYYAYVYPNQPYNIYLCRAFWSAPMTGTDSKAGTLIHEMSHFTVVAGTDDWVYGQSGAKSLAISDPNKAINNADNHEYFAENTPSLP